MSDIKLNMHYPFHPDYYYTTEICKVNLDEKRVQSLITGQGFVINKVQSSLKKDLKNPDGIYSQRFGQTLDDVNPCMDKYQCSCGTLRSRINHDILCNICNTRVKYVDDNFEYFGWMILNDPYYILHPNMYNTLNHLTGGKESLARIITPLEEKDIDGYIVKSDKPTEEPFLGIGMTELYNRIDEVLEYYIAKHPNKLDYYNEIIKNKTLLFTQSVPVYTLHLRPYEFDGTKFKFEDTNKLYNMMSKITLEINNDRTRISRNLHTKNLLLSDLQQKYRELHKEIDEILKGKKGMLRTLCGGKCNFTSRDVIVPNPSLRIDEVVLPYASLVELMQQTIVNILQKSYNISYSDAYSIWSKAQLSRDERVFQIIKGVIKSKPRGLPVLINRNPTISYGGILQMYVVDVVDNYTLGLPLQILPLLAADFDGDVLNVLYIINKDFYEASSIVLNPANAFYISRNDGKLATDVIPNRDTLVNANSLVGLARPNYSKEQIDRIAMAKATYMSYVS